MGDTQELADAIKEQISLIETEIEKISSSANLIYLKKDKGIVGELFIIAKSRALASTTNDIKYLRYIRHFSKIIQKSSDKMKKLSSKFKKNHK